MRLRRTKGTPCPRPTSTPRPQAATQALRVVAADPTEPVDNPLTASEQVRLQDLESKVREGWRISGKAFLQIKAEKLYRRNEQGNKQTWEQYCKDVHGISYAETLLHEVGGHWTEHRLGWTGSYADGEIRAEMAACFLVAALGIPDSGDLTNHAKYLASWLSAIEGGDTKFLFRASSAASKAADFFLSFSRPAEVPNAENEAVAA
jgi:hypothetical protein